MAEILLSDLNLPDGKTEISATALSTGLYNSAISTSVEYTSDMLNYELVNYIYTVTGINADYIDSLTQLTIPDYVGGYPVRKIKSGAFAGNTVLKYATLPNCLSEIGDSAFSGCTALSSVSFKSPSSITVYFRNNLGWTDVRCYRYYSENSYDELDGVAMGQIDTDGDATIHTITVSTFVKTIEFTGLDANSNRVRTLSISAEDILHNRCWEAKIYGLNYKAVVCDYSRAGMTFGTGVFSGCSALGTVTLPYNIKDITTNAFKDCTSLSKVNYHSKTNLISIGESAFENTAITTIENLPSTVTVISKNAFAGCTALESIHIPIGITRIEERTFYGCTNAEAVFIDSATPLESIGNGAFSNCLNLVAVQNLPTTLNSIGSNAFASCNLYTVIFDDPYGWFDINTDGDIALSYSALSEANAASDVLGRVGTSGLYKIDQMPAPTLDIDAEKLYIIDSTGIAESFRIYVNKEPKWLYDVASGKLTAI